MEDISSSAPVDDPLVFPVVDEPAQGDRCADEVAGQPLPPVVIGGRYLCLVVDVESRAVPPGHDPLYHLLGEEPLLSQHREDGVPEEGSHLRHIEVINRAEDTIGVTRE